KDYNQPKAINLELNKRFKLFIDQEFGTQAAAAEFLGVTPKVVSYIVRGIIDINPRYVQKLVKERKLNRQWYDYGKGKMKTDGSEKPKATITDINDMKAQIANLESQVARLEHNNKQMFRLLDELEKRLSGDATSEK